MTTKMQPRPGTDFRIDHDVLERSCWHAIEEADIDLLTVAGAVGFVDRSVRRRAGWRRELRVIVPVHDHARWLKAAAIVKEALDLVTGDDWEFEFVGASARHRQLKLQLASAPAEPVVTAFSGGLDSFLGAAQIAESGSTPILVTSATTGQVNVDARASAESLRTKHHFGVPVSFEGVGNHPEPSFRTRTFLFLAYATVAARLTGATTVVIGENGQGSIGASLVPFGHEVPYRNTHPRFTRTFARLVRHVLDRQVAIDHPFVWRTKGAVLRELHAKGIVSGWERTSSCSADVRRHKKTGCRMACGICGNCILRQVSVAAAGLTDPTVYYWPRDAALEARNTTDHNVKLATHSVLSMDAFARLADDAPALLSGADDLAEALELTRDDALSRVRALRAAHAEEWRGFLDALSTDSWVRTIVQVDS
jgi:7-cyano-7-deazaguanine synthase in queuosine biosynthesis